MVRGNTRPICRDPSNSLYLKPPHLDRLDSRFRDSLCARTGRSSTRHLQCLQQSALFPFPRMLRTQTQCTGFGATVLRRPARKAMRWGSIPGHFSAQMVSATTQVTLQGTFNVYPSHSTSWLHIIRCGSFEVSSEKPAGNT